MLEKKHWPCLFTEVRSDLSRTSHGTSDWLKWTSLEFGCVGSASSWQPSVRRLERMDASCPKSLDGTTLMLQRVPASMSLHMLQAWKTSKEPGKKRQPQKRASKTKKPRVREMMPITNMEVHGQRLAVQRSTHGRVIEGRQGLVRAVSYLTPEAAVHVLFVQKGSAFLARLAELNMTHPVKLKSAQKQVCHFSQRAQMQQCSIPKESPTRDVK